MQNIDRETAIDSKAIIPCPILTFRSKYAKNCVGCDYYEGLGVMCEDESKTWAERFTIRCAHPIERRTHIIEEPQE